MTRTTPVGLLFSYQLRSADQPAALRDFRSGFDLRKVAGTQHSDERRKQPRLLRYVRLRTLRIDLDAAREDIHLCFF